MGGKDLFGFTILGALACDRPTLLLFGLFGVSYGSTTQWEHWAEESSLPFGGELGKKRREKGQSLSPTIRSLSDLNVFY